MPSRTYLTSVLAPSPGSEIGGTKLQYWCLHPVVLRFYPHTKLLQETLWSEFCCAFRVSNLCFVSIMLVISSQVLDEPRDLSSETGVLQWEEGVPSHK